MKIKRLWAGKEIRDGNGMCEYCPYLRSSNRNQGYFAAFYTIPTQG